MKLRKRRNMNMLENKNTGFTLIEITVVLIILGAMATLGFPGIFAQIERNRAQEAVSTMGMIRSSIESCGVSNGGDFTNCTTWDAIGFDDPVNGNFTYHKTVGTANNSIDTGAQAFNNAGGYSIKATRTTSTDTVTITRTAGSVTCEGTGAYVGFC